MGRKRLSHRFGPLLAGWFGPAAVRCLGATLRVRHEPADLVPRFLAPGARVYAFWHGRLLVPAATVRGNGTAVMVSRHADGEVIARIVERLGFATVRGSSTRGGATALHDAIAGLRAGRSTVVTPDGPRGPLEVAHPGAVFAASRAGVPLVPVGVGVRGAWRLRSWDRFRIPRPFTTVALVLGEELRPPPDLEGESLEAWRRRLEEGLAAANARAEVLAGERAP
jgi:lysophospholipid acyltransferase (LPLAT)-like uncharacterized protein